MQVAGAATKMHIRKHGLSVECPVLQVITASWEARTWGPRDDGFKQELSEEVNLDAHIGVVSRVKIKCRLAMI
jgi:hypothetical protein